MSYLDSFKYGRRSEASFTREEIMKIRNTPPPDLTALMAEADRIDAEILRLREREHAASRCPLRG